MFALASDIVTILVCGVAPGPFYNWEAFDAVGMVSPYLATAAVVAAFFVLVMKGNGLYRPEELLDLRAQAASVTTTWLGVFLFLAGAVFALKIGSHFSRVAIFSFAASGLGFLLAERLLYRELLRRGLAGQKFSGRNAVLITDQEVPAAAAFARNLLKYGFCLGRQFVLPLEPDARARDAFVSDIVKFLRGSDIDEVVLNVDVTRWQNLNQLVSGLRRLPLRVMLVPRGAATKLLNQPAYALGDSVCIELQREPLATFERTAKRSVDLLVALGALILLLPLLAVIAVLIRLDSPGPVVFRQKRCGFNGRPFHIFKFRTMSVLEDGATVAQATKADGRVTRVGRRLRRSSLDELPQLLNVLNGSMSLVGPRPHAVAHDNHFDNIVRTYAFRRHVKPGLTGWAQVNGQRGPTPTVADIRRRVEFDLWYIDNWSLRLDFLIMMRTVFEVMRGRNAY